jgi:hypothetical protein
MEGVPVARVAEHQRQPFARAKVGAPIPGEKTFDGDDQSRPLGRDGRQKRFWASGHVPGAPNVLLPVEDPEGHGAGREIDAAVTLVCVAYECGIAKAGNYHIRAIAIEIAWGWLRFQPASGLTQWHQQRFGHGRSRLRRIGIVALARKLLMALWRYVETGVLPDGSAFKAAVRL